MNHAPGKLTAMRWLAAIVGVMGLLAAEPVWAQALVAPDEIVLHVHRDMKDTDFVEGLVCELGRVLVPPVRATGTDFPLSRADLATPTQLDADRLNWRFAQAIQNERGAFHYLIVPYDLKVDNLNYVFANTSLGGEPVAVMSPIRLILRDPAQTRKRISDVTSNRLYKLMLKSIALLSGLRSTGCVMAFPRSLPELDAKSDEFCPDDRARLIAAGVLKAKPFGACDVVAMARR